MYTVGLGSGVLGSRDPDDLEGEENPAASLKFPAAPTTDSLADCAASFTCSVAEDVVSLALCEASSTAEAAADSSLCSAGSGAFASASVLADAAIELSPCKASVAPSASGSDCVAASSLAHLF